MTRISKRWRSLAGIAVASLAIAACGGSGDGDFGSDDGDQSAEEEFAEAFAEAAGAGGGGTLMFDGEDIPIASVTCQLGEDTFDVGTISDNGFRVFVSQSNPLNDVNAQVLDSDSMQWFPEGVSGDEAQQDGKNFSSATTPYFNNQDDRIVQVSFSIDCP